MDVFVERLGVVKGDQELIAKERDVRLVAFAYASTKA